MNRSLFSSGTSIRHEAPARGSAEAPSPSVFATWAPEFTQKFGRKPFVVGHLLATCELFQLARLERLARDIYAVTRAGLAGDARLKPRRDSAQSNDMSGWTAKVAVALDDSKWEAQLAELFSGIGTDASGFSMMLSSANEVDPAYDDLLRQTLREVAAHTDLSLSDISFAGLTAIIAAPGAVTPYHNDHEQNFLFQISGAKDVHLYDQNDSVVMPQTTIEDSHVSLGGGAHFRKEFEALGAVYRLEPGLAVHHPALAPHWVRNGNNVSVSVSIHFSTRWMDDLSRVHQANWFLRRLGLKQPAPDLSRRADRLKADVFHRISGPRRCHADLFRGVERIRWFDRRVRTAVKSLRRPRRADLSARG